MYTNWELVKYQKRKEVPMTMLFSGNLVQAEFSHVGGLGKSIKDVMQECAERSASAYNDFMKGGEFRPNIKTVVRFHDRDGVVTKLAVGYERLERRIRAQQKLLPRLKGIKLWSLRRQIAAAYKRRDVLRAEIDQTVIVMATRSRDSVVYEDPACHERTLIDVPANAWHEFVESISTAQAQAWVFVFQPNHLYSSKNKLIASVM